MMCCNLRIVLCIHIPYVTNYTYLKFDGFMKNRNAIELCIIQKVNYGCIYDLSQCSRLLLGLLTNNCLIFK